LADQERLCRQEADRLGYTVAKIFRDKALSGALGEKERPGFAAMLEAAKRHEFDILVVDDSSRLSRDTSDALRVLKRLEFWGIGFIARSDGINTVQNPKSSRLMFGVKASFNEEFLRDLAEKVHRGLEGQARRGLSAGGLPYGYRSEPIVDERGRVTGHRRVIHEEEARVVRRIFKLYAGGSSAREIAKVLTKERVAPPGARWPNRTVRQAAS
jgi:DNA invertase Pin-like site-specific DNA recombinase